MKPISAHKAVRYAFRDHPLKLRGGCWDILLVLYEAEKPISMPGIQFELNGGKQPDYEHYNSWYYKALERLVKNGLADLHISKGGFRKWSITIAGITAIHEINKAAQSYIDSH